MRQLLAASGEARARMNAAVPATRPMMRVRRTRIGLRASAIGLRVSGFRIDGLELHGYWFAVGFAGLEELASLEVEHAGQNVGGEHLYFRVQIAHHGVVVTARVLDGVFRLAQRALQLRELLGRF